ncbi:efflux RND transporter periplasmic adaptor subunit [Hydrocarboniphaga effusa]|jgi:RND family efflux transporter MFP subunit|uniref:efflux RND transporter periplasmic adaptor subunit n=1 Tax=Hydrocarboniphaga effusa TaxID=243629 RepID=UPI00398BFE71
MNHASPCTSMSRAGSLPSLALLNLVSGIALLGVSACSGGQASSAPAPATQARTVRAAQVETGPARPAIRASGLLTAVNESSLSFRSAGTVRSVEVRAGASVKAGQLLATLETPELDAGLRQARERLAQRRRDRERADRLFADEALSREERDNAHTAEALASADLQAARFRSQLQIRAPGDGVVLRRLVEPGANVSAGGTVLVIGRQSGDSGLALRVGLSDRDVVSLRLGDPAQLRFAAYGDRRFTGHVSEIAASTDALLGSYAVQITLADAAPGMSSGMIGSARIAARDQDAQRRSYLPLTALVDGDQAAVRVFLLDGERVRERELAVAFIDGERVALATELPANSRVITDGATELRDGDPVRVVDRTERSPGTRHAPP